MLIGVRDNLCITSQRIRGRSRVLRFAAVERHSSLMIWPTSVCGVPTTISVTVRALLSAIVPMSMFAPPQTLVAMRAATHLGSSSVWTPVTRGRLLVAQRFVVVLTVTRPRVLRLVTLCVEITAACASFAGADSAFFIIALCCYIT